MGSGYRVFTAGEVLTASNVQNYLQDQAVMVFGGTAARSSAIGTANFEEGMLTYLTDVDKLQVYTGAAFADVYPAAASTQGLTLINTTSFSGVASQSINDVFSATYTNYLIRIEDFIISTANDDIFLRMRVGGADLSGSVYAYQYSQQSGSTGAISRATSQNKALIGSAANTDKNSIIIDIFSPFETKTTLLGSTGICTINTIRQDQVSNVVGNTTSYTGFTIFPNSNNLSGTICVYGYNR
jgi:hypothetical protein